MSEEHVKVKPPMSEHAFWLGFWSIVAFVACLAIGAYWESYRRDREFDRTAPVVETCVKHNVRQKIKVD